MRGAKKEEIRLDVGLPDPSARVPGGLSGYLQGGEAGWIVVYLSGGRSGIRNWPARPVASSCQAQEILEKKLPELDDNFARGIDPNLDLEGLKAKLRVRLESEELMQSRERLETGLIDRLLAAEPLHGPRAGWSSRASARTIEKAREDGEELSEEEFSSGTARSSSGSAQPGSAASRTWSARSHLDADRRGGRHAARHDGAGGRGRGFGSSRRRWRRTGS